MRILRRLKRLFNKSDESSELNARTVPAPVRINLSDHQVPGGHFTYIADWDAILAAPPQHSLPTMATQMLWIDGMITSHKESGSLDAYTPDLLDRWIENHAERQRAQIESAHQHALYTAHRLFEQAKIAQTTLSAQLVQARDDLARAERGYERAYEFLTWEKPAKAAGPRLVSPALIRTETAETDTVAGPIAWPDPQLLPPISPVSPQHDGEDPEPSSATVAV